MTKAKRLIRLASRALEEPCRVRVYVYDDRDHMVRDAIAFSGDTNNAGALAVTHAWADAEGRARLITMRFWREALGTEVVTHEMHHASTALYGATLPDKVDRAEVLTHFNEPFAYLHGELVRKLVNRLHALGYYADEETP